VLLQRMSVERIKHILKCYDISLYETSLFLSLKPKETPLKPITIRSINIAIVFYIILHSIAMLYVYVNVRMQSLQY